MGSARYRTRKLGNDFKASRSGRSRMRGHGPVGRRAGSCPGAAEGTRHLQQLDGLDPQWRFVRPRMLHFCATRGLGSARGQWQPGASQPDPLPGDQPQDAGDLQRGSDPGGLSVPSLPAQCQRQRRRQDLPAADRWRGRLAGCRRR